MSKIRLFWLSITVFAVIFVFWWSFAELSDVRNRSLLPKINGVSWVAPPQAVGDSTMASVKKVNANWACLMPFGFADPAEPKLHYLPNKQWWGETPEGIIACIEMAKRQGLQVMLKPQVWLKKGGYTGHFRMETEKDWKAWEDDYSRYILSFAHLADSTQVEMLCIGTEWHTFFKERPAYWKNLIQEVRSVYNGKITYAANWDAYGEFPHWKLLDYIGVDAYFPLSHEMVPTADSLTFYWQRWKSEMKQLSEKTGIPVLLTEYGYRSIDFPTQKPWESYTEVAYNGEAQANALEGLYQNLWNESWIAGGFLWKWFPINRGHREGTENTRFTPQDKPAEKVMAKWYGKIDD